MVLVNSISAGYGQHGWASQLARTLLHGEKARREVDWAQLRGSKEISGNIIDNESVVNGLWPGRPLPLPSPLCDKRLPFGCRRAFKFSN